MDFNLTEEQTLIVSAVRRFARERVAPAVAAYDREERFPVELVQELAELGWMGGVIPEEFGGAGLDYLTHAILVEELSRTCHIMGLAVSLASGLTGSSLLHFGTPAQKEKYLKPLAQGTTLGATGVTEPHSGTDVGAMETRCRRVDGGYVLNGAKTWISFLDVAGWILTFATLGTDESTGKERICAFVVDRDSEGLSLHPFKNKLGFRPLATGEVVLDDVFVPTENRIGEEGQGYMVAMTAVENGRLGVAARATGLAGACLDAATAYARERIVFDQPIGRFQMVQQMISDMVQGVETAQLLVRKLAWTKDQGLRARREASLTKMYASDVAMDAATKAAQIHGAYCASDEYPVGRYFRDAKIFQIVEGNNQLHKAMVAEYALDYRT